MNLENLNKWLTLLANIGVLAGIIFLAVEIEQNTAAVYSSSVQALTDNSAEGLRAYAADANLAALRLKGDFDSDALTELESFQYLAHNRGYWIHFQNVFFQVNLGALQPAVWATYKRIICEDIATRPGLRADWSGHAAVLDPEFVAVVESCPEF